MKRNPRLTERLSQAARHALLDLQPATVREALRIRGVGRKATARLLALHILRDPGAVQRDPRAAAEPRIER